jgi:hypothetical protein
VVLPREFHEGLIATICVFRSLILMIFLAHPKGFEPLASAFGGQRSWGSLAGVSVSARQARDQIGVFDTLRQATP